MIISAADFLSSLYCAIWLIVSKRKCVFFMNQFPELFHYEYAKKENASEYLNSSCLQRERKALVLS